MHDKVLHGVTSVWSRSPTVGRLIIATAALCVSVDVGAWFPVFSQAPSEQQAPAWSYQGEDGPENWGALSADFALCQAGKQQSPIDIRQAKRMVYDPLSFHYRSAPLDLVFDGRVVRGHYATGSYLMTGGHRYDLKAFEIHVPGEHRIQGRQADMEMQLMHQDAQGRRLNVAVLIRAGRRHNSLLRRLWEHLPEQVGQQTYDRQAGINLVFLLPARRDYFLYSGSLTAPPCTEGVDWAVMTEPLEVDVQYIRRMRAIVGDNARPVQSIGERGVLGFLTR